MSGSRRHRGKTLRHLTWWARRKCGVPEARRTRSDYALEKEVNWQNIRRQTATSWAVISASDINSARQIQIWVWEKRRERRRACWELYRLWQFYPRLRSTTLLWQSIASHVRKQWPVNSNFTPWGEKRPWDNAQYLPVNSLISIAPLFFPSKKTLVLHIF